MLGTKREILTAHRNLTHNSQHSFTLQIEYQQIVRLVYLEEKNKSQLHNTISTAINGLLTNMLMYIRKRVFVIYTLVLH